MPTASCPTDILIIQNNQTVILGMQVKGCYCNNKDCRYNGSNAWVINLELQVFMSSTIISSHE